MFHKTFLNECSFKSICVFLVFFYMYTFEKMFLFQWVPDKGLKSIIRYIWTCFKYVRTYFDTVTLWYFLRWISYENLIPLQPYRHVSLRLNPLITFRKNSVQLFTSLYFPDMEDKAADIKTIHINPLLLKCTVIPQVRSFRGCNHELIGL